MAGRSSPRQALAVLATTTPEAVLAAIEHALPVEAAAVLWRGRLLDTVSGLTRVNGVTISDVRSVAGVEARARAAGLVVRRVEPRKALLDHRTMAELRDSIAGLADDAPRLVAWLERHDPTRLRSAS